MIRPRSRQSNTSRGDGGRDPGPSPAQPHDPRLRPLLGILVGTVVLAAVAVPAYWTAMLTVAAVSGCFLECGEPRPGAAVLWGTVTVLLVVLPVSAGSAVAGARQRWAWLFGLVAAAALGVLGALL